jgi:chromate reductase, NAD(P)H dehydrogenase (quinone)
MLLIINGTNRPNNKTSNISNYCYQYLEKNFSGEVKYLSMEDLNPDFLHSGMYDPSQQSASLTLIQNEFILPAKQWLIISPEYNGSFPGILKLFIDAISVREYKANFEHKFVGLIGTSSGRAGNARGMDQLTTFLNYLKMSVFHNKLPISLLSQVIKEGEIEENTQKVLNAYLDEFINTI